MLAHPVVVVNGAEIAETRVREEGDDSRRCFEAAGELAYSPQRRSTRSTGEDGFGAGELSGGLEGVAVRDSVDIVDEIEVGAGDQFLVAETFDEVSAGLDQLSIVEVIEKDRPLGIDGDDLDGWVALLEETGDTADRAAGSDAGNDVVDLPGHLAPDLRARRTVVGL